MDNKCHNVYKGYIYGTKKKKKSKFTKPNARSFIIINTPDFCSSVHSACDTMRLIIISVYGCDKRGV